MYIYSAHFTELESIVILRKNYRKFYNVDGNSANNFYKNGDPSI